MIAGDILAKDNYTFRLNYFAVADILPQERFTDRQSVYSRDYSPLAECLQERRLRGRKELVLDILPKGQNVCGK